MLEFFIPNKTPNHISQHAETQIAVLPISESPRSSSIVTFLREHQERCDVSNNVANIEAQYIQYTDRKGEL